MKTKRTDLLHIPFSKIAKEEDFNVRYDYGDIESLAKSIFENGVKVPIRVKKERGKDLYILTDGHRRMQAIRYAMDNFGMEEPLVPAILEKVGVTEEERNLSLVILNSGKNLTMLEEARVYQRLVESGMNQTQIAKAVGKSKMHVSNCMRLLKAPPVVLEKVEQGKLSASYVISAIKDGEIDKLTTPAYRLLDAKKERKKRNTISRKLVENIAEVCREYTVFDDLLQYLDGDMTADDLKRKYCNE